MPLEVERIPGVGTKTEEILKLEMGIESIGQLAELRCSKTYGEIW